MEKFIEFNNPFIDIINFKNNYSKTEFEIINYFKNKKYIKLKYNL